MARSSSIVIALVAAVLICCCTMTAQSAGVHHHVHQRLARSSSNSSGDAVNNCSEDTPCGWAIYMRFTRVVDYFMKNTCTCQQGRECIRVDDDVSVSAYVYKCRPVPSNSRTTS